LTSLIELHRASFHYSRKRFPMSDEPDDELNDPIDDELDDAMTLAVELVARANRIGMEKLELRIPDQSGSWTVIVKKSGLTEHQVPDADGNGAHRDQHDGKIP